jgi:hypothetical protein
MASLLQRLLSAGDQTMLPQGNPLSPLLANLYAHETIDKVAMLPTPFPLGL